MRAWNFPWELKRCGIPRIFPLLLKIETKELVQIGGWGNGHDILNSADTKECTATDKEKTLAKQFVERLKDTLAVAVFRLPGQSL